MKNDKLSKDFDKVGGSGRTPLFDAVEDSDIFRVYRLLKDGADVNATCRKPRGFFSFVYDVPYATGSTPLHVAALAGDYFIAEMLLEKKADPNRANDKGETPLDNAIVNLSYYQQRLDDAEKAGKRQSLRHRLEEKIDDYEVTIESLIDAGAKPSLFALPENLLHLLPKKRNGDAPKP